MHLGIAVYMACIYVGWPNHKIKCRRPIFVIHTVQTRPNFTPLSVRVFDISLYAHLSCCGVCVIERCAYIFKLKNCTRAYWAYRCIITSRKLLANLCIRASMVSIRIRWRILYAHNVYAYAQSSVKLVQSVLYHYCCGIYTSNEISLIACYPWRQQNRVCRYLATWRHADSSIWTS